jgi:hypothetical protein
MKDKKKNEGARQEGKRVKGRCRLLGETWKEF